ncbi:MAG TPA: beta-galactosidase [Jatrophihabitans sp.]|nr:beta-galactosidase [Jatrophihabitans sp.]
MLLRKARHALAVIAAATLLLAVTNTVTAVGTAPASGAAHTVTFDNYSLMLDGKRTVIWSGEFHYWRLPSPGLWRDVLQKMKAEGYNAVSIYFNWAYHSPAPGVYDFTGVRDVDRLLDIAQQVGLYVIARPGPYINAETSAGGFPGWLTTQAGRARSDAPDYLAAADDWLTHIDAILQRHQFTNGTGPVILYEIENELANTGTSQRNYLQHLYDKVRSDGVTVPIFHNDKGRNGFWVPSSSDVPGTVPGPVDMYAFDGYPGGTCHTDGTPGGPSTAPDWGIWGPGGAKGGASASPYTPGFAAEFGGGWFDYWGSVGTYPCTAIRQGVGYERVFYKTNIANRLSIQNFYMTFGGTSWGWLPAPVVYTSYDYGAAFDEARQIRPKATAMKEIGLFLQSVKPITKIDRADAVTPSSSAIKVYHDVNPDTGTHFYIAMHNPSNATTNDAFTFPISTSDGDYTLSTEINGQDGKIFVADYDLGGQHLVYSTSEIMTHLTQAGKDVALLYGRNGENGETVLRYDDQPHVQVLSGNVTSSYDAATGDLRLDYTHDGLAEVQINGGNRPQLTLLIADDANAGTFWRQDTSAGPVLERGPELVRTAVATGASLALTGDTKQPSPLQVWAPPQLQTVTWNGAALGTSLQPDGSRTVSLPGAEPISLPSLDNWRWAPGSPEAQPGFDDSSWIAADKSTTNSTTKPPAGQPVLTADDYGFHQGDVWYRGRYSGSPGATTISLRYGGGGAGMLQAWLDGVYLGQHVLPNGVESPATTGTVTFGIPHTLQTEGGHTLAVMVRNDGHNEDGGVNDAQKEGRGLISATMADSSGASVPTAIDWRIQGDLGGENIVDPVRGVENNGGLYGERHGWYLPGYPDSSWAPTAVPAGTAMSGTSWYRTRFDLDIPATDDASLGITIGDPATPRSAANYRALLFVNGWNVGQYIANVGPQHTFVVPNGVLDPHGTNTLAIAVTSDGGAGNGLENVRLTDLGTVRGGVPVSVNPAPAWSRQTWGDPSVPNTVAMAGFTGDARSPARGGDTFHVSGTIANLRGPDATDVEVALDLPDGWTATPDPTVQVGSLPAGDSAPVSWTVTIPDDAQGRYAVGALVTYEQDGVSGRTGAAYSLNVLPKGLVYLSDVPWVSAVSGFHDVLRDQNVNGGPLSIAGVPYAKGLGTNAVSSIVYDVPADCTSFATDVGVDDAAGTSGSVTFSVLVDGNVVASTGVLRGRQAAVPINVDVTGVHQLTLNAGDAGDGIGHDNADWADAHFGCQG